MSLIQRINEIGKRNRLDFMKKISHIHKNPDFPSEIEFELIDGCNLKCKFCYRRKDGVNTGASISDEAFQKVIDEAVDKGGTMISFAYGEPLLRRNIADLISYAYSKGLLDTELTTNGLLLTEETSEKLISSGLSRLYISVDAHNSDTYRKIRGGNLEILKRNIEFIIKRKGEFPFLRLNYLLNQDNKGEVEEFINYWQEKVDAIKIQDYFDHSLVDSLRDFAVKEFNCNIPYEVVVVRGNGDIQFCCSFYSKYFTLGNIIKGDSIESAWKSDRAQKLRQSFVSKDYDIYCKNCKGTQR